MFGHIFFKVHGLFTLGTVLLSLQRPGFISKGSSFNSKALGMKPCLRPAGVRVETLGTKPYTIISLNPHSTLTDPVQEQVQLSSLIIIVFPKSWTRASKESIVEVDLRHGDLLSMELAPGGGGGSLCEGIYTKGLFSGSH